MSPKEPQRTLVTFIGTTDYRETIYQWHGIGAYKCPHIAAAQWVTRQGISIDRTMTHLDLSDVLPGDVLIGTLPVHLAAEVCSRGARYLHLTLELPAGWRGRELTAGELAHCGARLVEFSVGRIERSP
ncbi:MAG: CRISPR-associated protein Csx16 [Acidobacteria bacterium]|nr:MAG: CRISPR-associated protein Csx16 [Acidobacteriota bacterium]